MKWLGRRDKDYAEEIQAHIDMEVKENIERGLPPDEAKRAACVTFGNAVAVRETLWQARPWHWLETIRQDLRYGCRLIARGPLLACAVVVTLTVGIGLNAGVFTLLNAMLFRAEVDRAPAEFLSVYVQYAFPNGDRTGISAVSSTDYRAYRDGVSPITDLAAWQFEDTATDGANPHALRAVLVSCNFFAVYGLDRPKLGRLFIREDCAAPGSAPVAVISEEFWRDEFGSDPNILGTAIPVNHDALTVVGVAPARFAGRLGQGALWIPYTMQPRIGSGQNGFQPSASPWLNLSGRLAPGSSRSDVQAHLRVIANQQDQQEAGRKTDLIVTNGSAVQAPGKGSAAFMIVPLFMTPLTLVLLIACVNVSTLLLSRAAARQMEMAVRVSLGAGRSRLVRMLVTESLILAAAAGALSVVLAYQMPGFLLKLLGQLPNYSLEPDWRVFAYLASVTVLAAGVAGLAPAAESLRVDLSASLKGREALLSSTGRRGPRHGFLVGIQVALSLVLLVGAGMVARAQYLWLSADPNFETRQVLTVRVTPPSGGARDQGTAQSVQSLLLTLKERVRALPVVQSACYCTAPFNGHAEEVSLPLPRNHLRQLASPAEAAPEFFQTLSIPILRGRTFTAKEADRQTWAPVTVVSQDLAHFFWPAEDPIGKQILDGSGNALDVVGVARETTSGPFDSGVGQFYVLKGRRQSGEVPHSNELLVRFSGDPGVLENAIRKVATDVDRGILIKSQTLGEEIAATGRSLWPVTVTVLFLGSAGGVLALVGVYGVVAFSVSRRTKEFGVRMALGANRREIIRLVLRSGVRPILVGVFGGVLLSLGAAQVVARVPRMQGSVLDTHDPMVYVAVSLLLGFAAIAAMFAPALRAAGSDPVWALRQD
jgi:predicted permease